MEAKLTHEQVDAVRSALYSALNCQGALAAGCRLGAWACLDAEYHDRKIRSALAALDAAAPEELFPELEDPEEVAPCLVCGEPKPNREACPTCQEAEKEAQA